MKEIIKITIALAVILGSYLLGSHQADDKFSTQLKEVNEKLSVSQVSIEQLKDSINSMQKLITQIRTQKNAQKK